LTTFTATPQQATRESVRRALGGRRRDVGGLLFEIGLLVTLLLSLGALVTLVSDVLIAGLGVLGDRGARFLTDGLSSFPSRAGVGQGLVGSMLLMAFVVMIAFPLGVGAAVYMEEYARDTPLTRFINANIRNLAGVPSIVYGLLGLAVFVKVLGGLTGGNSLMAGGLTLAIMVLPIVIITSAEAIRAVPNAIREAGFGVGATRWEVIRSHVLPCAAPGILTGTVLSLARAFGETAPLILVGAVTGFFATSGGLLDQLRDRFTSLPTIIFRWSTLPREEFRALTAAAILVLLAVIFVVNLTAIVMRNRYERRW